MSRVPSIRPRLQATIALVVAVGVWLALGNRIAAGVAVVMAILAVLAWAAPAAYAPVHRGLERGAHALAAAVSWVLLGGAYLGLFLPLRLWRSITRRDPLALRPDERSDTFLRPVPPAHPERFRRMF